jgi:hypothetical protein
LLFFCFFLEAENNLMKQFNHMQQTSTPANTANNSNQMKLFGDMAQFLVAVAAASSSSNNSSTANNQATMPAKCTKSTNSLSSPNANLFNSIGSFQFPTNQISTAPASAPTTASLSPNSISSQAAALAAAYKYTSSLYSNLQQQQMTSGTASLPAPDLFANLNAQKQQLQQNYTASLMKYMSYYYSNGALTNSNSANKSLEYVQRLLAEQQANSAQNHAENQMLIDCNNGSSFYLPNQIPTNISPISHKHYGKQNHRFHPYSKGSIDSLGKFESNKSSVSKKSHMTERCSPSSPTSPCSAFSSTISNHMANKSPMKKQQNYQHLELQQQQQQSTSSPTSRSTTPISPNTTIDSSSIHMSNDSSIDASRVLTADDQ